MSARVLQLCLFHDIPEARTGDLNYVNKKYVRADEAKAVDDLAAHPPLRRRLPGPARRIHRQRARREALLAHDADQLEMILALKEHKDLGNRYADEWYPFSRAAPADRGGAEAWPKRSGPPIRAAGGSTATATGGSSGEVAGAAGNLTAAGVNDRKRPGPI